MKHLVFALFLFIAACQPQRDTWLIDGDGQRQKLAYEETLSAAITSEPPSIDWLKSSDTDSSWIEEHLMDGLVAFDFSKPKLEIKPALALSWQSKEGGRVWQFQLRDDVKWSDGVPFTSQHVYDAFKRILEPATGAIAVDNIYPILNAKLYNEGRVKDFSQVGVKIISPHEIKFVLEKPMTFFPMLLAHHTTFPVRMDVIEKHQELWTEPENLVVLGPYKLKHWHHDSRLVLERNEGYWGDAPKIKYVVFYMVGKSSTQLRMFERGRIDFMRDLPSSEIPRLRKWPEFQTFPGLRLYYIGFKVQKKPFDNKRVRQAINMAIDRHEIVKVLGGGQYPLKSWVPYGMFGFEEDLGLEYNPQKAAKLLDEAGFKNRDKIPSIVLGFNTEEKHKRVAENIQAQLKKNLGIRIELKNEEWKTFLNGLRSASAYSMFRLGWVADYADPHNFMAILVSYSENNRTGWKNLEFDQLVSKALSESDPAKRLETYRRAQKIIVEEEIPALPILTDVNQLLVSKRIKNFQNNVLDIYHFHTMELSR